MGFSGTTRSVLLGVGMYCRHLLRSSTLYAILFPVHRKETKSGCLYARSRRILYTRRDSGYPQNNGGLCYQTSQTQQNAWIQSRRFLEDQQNGVPRVHGQPQEHQARRQKIKPAVGWPPTIENLVAFRSSALLWKVKANDPWISLPTFSIVLALKKVKAMHRRAG